MSSPPPYSGIDRIPESLPFVVRVRVWKVAVGGAITVAVVLFVWQRALRNLLRDDADLTFRVAELAILTVAAIILCGYWLAMLSQRNRVLLALSESGVWVRVVTRKHRGMWVPWEAVGSVTAARGGRVLVRLHPVSPEDEAWTRARAAPVNLQATKHFLCLTAITDAGSSEVLAAVRRHAGGRCDVHP